MNDFLKDLRGDPNFNAALLESRQLRPVIPEFSLAKTEPEQNMIIERIKYHTAMRQGFDLLYQHLTGRKPGE